MEKEGKPIAIIKGGKYDGETVYISDNIKYKGLTEMDLTKVGGKFQPIENPKIDRSVNYITAPSGSGKSYFIGQYITELKKNKKFKESPIYLISPFKEDKSLDKIKPLRLNVDDIVENPINWKDFDKGSIIIFDDMDVFKKSIRDALYILLDHLLKAGRHEDLNLFITQHDPTGRHLQTLLNESSTITIFPWSGSKRKILYLVENYTGLTKEDFFKIRKTKSRWALIGKNFPMYVITEQLIYTPNEDDELDEKD